MNTDEPRLEREVRMLRDNIYGLQSDAGWDACKDNWMKPGNIEWLRRQPQNRHLHSSV